MRNVAIDIRGEEVPGYLKAPASGSGPGVIVIQEWWGLVPHIQSVVDRFAEAGFTALAVDHYRGVETTEPDEAQKLMLGLNIEQVAADFAAAAMWLAARDEVVGDELAAVGFCMGGGLALLAPTVSEHIDRAVGFYPATPWPDYSPEWSRYAGKAAMVHKAQSDEQGMGPSLAEYARQIVASGGTCEFFEYPGSVHAFFNDARPEVFQADNAELAWQRTLDFLRRG